MLDPIQLENSPLNQSLSKLSHNKYDFILTLNPLILTKE
jgi:hypothetical protein